MFTANHRDRRSARPTRFSADLRIGADAVGEVEIEHREPAQLQHLAAVLARYRRDGVFALPRPGDRRMRGVRLRSARRDRHGAGASRRARAARSRFAARSANRLGSTRQGARAARWRGPHRSLRRAVRHRGPRQARDPLRARGRREHDPSGCPRPLAALGCGQLDPRSVNLRSRCGSAPGGRHRTRRGSARGSYQVPVVPVIFSHPPCALVLLGILHDRTMVPDTLRARTNWFPVATEVTVSV